MTHQEIIDAMEEAHDERTAAHAAVNQASKAAIARIQEQCKPHLWSSGKELSFTNMRRCVVCGKVA